MAFELSSCAAKNRFHRDARHAPVIDGTAAQMARSARRRIDDDLRRRRQRARQFRIGWAEDHQRRRAQRAANVGRARIVADEQRGSAEQRHRLLDGERTDKRVRFASHSMGDFTGDFDFARRTDEDHCDAQFFDQAVGQGGKARRRPTLRFAVG